VHVHGLHVHAYVWRAGANLCVCLLHAGGGVCGVCVVAHRSAS
jgi:hypothetical protein